MSDMVLFQAMLAVTEELVHQTGELGQTCFMGVEVSILGEHCLHSGTRSGASGGVQIPSSSPYRLQHRGCFFNQIMHAQSLINVGFSESKRVKNTHTHTFRWLIQWCWVRQISPSARCTWILMQVVKHCLTPDSVTSSTVGRSRLLLHASCKLFISLTVKHYKHNLTVLAVDQCTTTHAGCCRRKRSRTLRLHTVK